MPPENSKPKPPRPWWSSDAEDRAIDTYFDWRFYTEAEDRSLDRLIEMARRRTATARAILDLKTRLIAAGVRITYTSTEHAMIAADFEGWARTERDPKKAAELANLGRLARALCKSAHVREAKRPRARKR